MGGGQNGQVGGAKWTIISKIPKKIISCILIQKQIKSDNLCTIYSQKIHFRALLGSLLVHSYGLFGFFGSLVSYIMQVFKLFRSQNVVAQKI